MGYFVLPKSNEIFDLSNFLTINDNKDFSIFCNKTLYEYLNKIKSKINNIQHLWDKYKKFTNTYEYIHTNLPNTSNSICKYKPLSRSFFKMIEIGHTFKIFDNLPSDKCNSFHLAEGPGGFIEALVKVRNNLDDRYYGITLESDSDYSIPGWAKSHYFLKNNKNVIIESGLTKDGDLLKSENLIHYSDLYINKFDLITGDGGFDFTIDYNKQEFYSLKLIYAQVAYAIACQKTGGTFVIKMFDTFSLASLDILYILSCAYTEIMFYKPQSSRSANSEKYIICKNFRIQERKNLVVEMIKIIDRFDNISIPLRFLNIELPYKFICAIQEINAIYGQNQLETIHNTLQLINEDKYEKLEIIKKNNISKVINWCHKFKLPYNKTLINSNSNSNSNSFYNLKNNSC